ncbi:MAG TPA: carbamate kinase [Candidatus Binatia bacterium]|nr:carbamate kinase [Candidatus Binatia bacterium]
MRLVIALGGNALIRRGQAPDLEVQRHNLGAAVHSLARLIGDHQVAVTHGNGPQVGLLALQSATLAGVEPYPLDVLDAESAGMIGYLLQVELGNALGDRSVATLLTEVVVEPGDAAFEHPTKFIGPVYEESTAHRMARAMHWTVHRDGTGWRRVVPSPRPREIRELGAIRILFEAGVVVVCAGGGGVPVVIDRGGIVRGIEAVVDKDLASALLAERLNADALLLLTDVEGVQEGFGTPAARTIRRLFTDELEGLSLPDGSMGPKVTAARQFAERTGGMAGIGRLEDGNAILAGDAGTLILPRARRTLSSHTSAA